VAEPTPPVLQARDLAKSYGGVTALDGAGITLRSGEIHALVGENGAGKSTLVKILCGVVAPESGALALDGEPVSFAGRAQAVNSGIAFVAQELSLFPDLSVRENLFPQDPLRRLGLVRNRANDARARPVLDRLGLKVDLGARLGDLSLSEQQLLEIGRAMLADPRVLVLDEPTSALSRETVGRLEKVLRSLAAEGLAVLYISHFLEEVLRIANRITILRDSRVVLDDEAIGRVDLDRMVTAMIGRSLGTPEPSTRRVARKQGVSDLELRLDAAAVVGRLEALDLRARAGEIVGFAGLQGAGHDAVLELVCGRTRPDQGCVRLPDGAEPRSMRHAFTHGVALVPSDRKGLGLMLDKSVWENISAVRWMGLQRDGFWQRSGRHRRLAEDLMGRLELRGGVDSVAGQLSGGNQQKVVFAKWLATDPTVMVLDDPTRGVDIGVRAEMHDVVRELAAQGRVALVASSDLAELTELCDRVVVFQRGRVVAELSGDELTQQELSRSMNAGFAYEARA